MDTRGRKVAFARGRYTLVEILIVIAIIGMMIYMGLPAFEKILTGTGVELTARNMTSKLGMARNYAISKRKTVALLMPTTGLPDQYCFSATRTCIVDSTGSYNGGTQVTTYSFQRWIEGENWDFLTVGSVIIHVDNAAGYSSTIQAHEQVDGVKCTDIGASYSSVDNVRAIIFKPTGKIDCDSSAYGDRYVTIGEGAYSSAGLVRKNTKNELDIKIDKYSGRISYGSK